MPAAALRSRAASLPVPDWDHLRSAAFVAATTGVGFLIWIFFNPPGHALWFQFSGTIALMVALAPNIRASKLIVPVAVTSAVCLAIYVFVMPQLSSFLGLGSLLFVTMFITAYFFSGLARFFCSMAILNMLPIQNHQQYSFAAMANIFIFFVMVFAFLFMMSYLLSSPRPEKAVLHLLDRFFRSAEFLMSRREPGFGRVSGLDRWRIAFHERQLRSIPAKLGAWGKSIDSKLFPDNTPEQIQSLVTSIQGLVYRLDQLLEAGAVPQAESLARELRGDVKTWHAGIGTTFGKWARNPEAEPVAALRQRLEAGREPTRGTDRGRRQPARACREQRRGGEFLPLARWIPGCFGSSPGLCRSRPEHQLRPMAGRTIFLTQPPANFGISAGIEARWVAVVSLASCRLGGFCRRLS